MDAYAKKAGWAVTSFALASAVIAGAGCDDREHDVRAYGAPKEPVAATAPTTAAMASNVVDARPVGAPPPVPSDTAGTAPAPAAAPAAAAAQDSSMPLQWTLPEGWKQDPQPRAMRVATVFVEEGGQKAELIVTRFRTGGFGGVVDNINRWRQQVGLPPVKDESEAKPEKTTVGGMDAKVYDFTGPAAEGNPAKRNRVVMVDTPAGDAWFFRFNGPADLIEKQRGAFDSLLKSVKFST